MSRKKITGLLDSYLGPEGMEWVFYNENGIGPAVTDVVLPIEPGDHLKIFGEDDSIVFDGVIVPDKETGKIPHPHNPNNIQQYALGWWVYWIQEGWKPDDWSSLFIRDIVKDGQIVGKKPLLRAELIKKS